MNKAMKIGISLRVQWFVVDYQDEERKRGLVPTLTSLSSWEQLIAFGVLPSSSFWQRSLYEVIVCYGCFHFLDYNVWVNVLRLLNLEWIVQINRYPALLRFEYAKNIILRSNAYYEFIISDSVKYLFTKLYKPRMSNITTQS